MGRKSLVVALLLAFMMAIGPGLYAADQMAPSSVKPAKSDQAAKKAGGKAEVTTPININTADAAELQKLPGIGPATAKDIVSYRDANGPFKSTEELKQVKGLKGKKYEAIKNKVTVQ